MSRLFLKIISNGSRGLKKTPRPLNYLDVIQSREDKLLNFLSRPRTMQEIVGAWIVYGREREPKELYEFGERTNIQKHIEKLLAQDVIEFDGGKYHRIK